MTLFKFAPSNVMVMLLEGDGAPIAAWMFLKAFPVKWTTADLSAGEDRVLIDTLELCYSNMQAMRV
jgi:phage tail-like protein